MRLAIGIKALNEAKHIAMCVESALAAVKPFGGEVILADSGSQDETIAIAGQYPIKIAQLAHLEERCCGIGAQLAFQESSGEYFYLLDGDMVIKPEFITEGIAFLEANPHVAAVGGRVNECVVTGQEFQIRFASLKTQRHWQPGIVDRLDCGGLYRRSAIEQVGYFADRNLHAFEEFELGARLRAAGWQLARIDCAAVDHYGHSENGFRLLFRRMTSGYSGAVGEVLRAATNGPHARLVLRDLSHVRYGALVFIWWILLAASLFSKSPLWLTAALLIAPLVFLSFRRRSLQLGLYSLTAWNVSALGILTGIVRRRVNPRTPVRSRIIKS